MKKILKNLLILSLLTLFIVSLSSAISGELGTSGSIVQNTSILAESGGTYPITGMVWSNTELMSGFTSLIAQVDGGYATNTSDNTYVDLYIGNTIVGNGTFGFNYNSVTGFYNVFYIGDTLDIGSRSGTSYINFTVPSQSILWNLSHISAHRYVGGLNPAEADFVSINNPNNIAATTLTTKQSIFYNDYNFVEVDSPISEVFVTKQLGGHLYSSKVYIYSGNTLLASESTSNTNDYDAVFYQLPIKIAIFDTYSRWWNTSPMTLGQETYNISVSPSTILSGESTLITIDTGLFTDSISYIFLYDNYDDINGVYQTKTIGKYKHISGSTFQKYNTTSGLYETSSDNPLAYTYSNVPTGNHTISAHLVFTGGLSSVDVSTLLTVIGTQNIIQNPVIISINAFDAVTNGYIINYNLNVKNLNTETWDNYTFVPLTKELTFNAGTDLYLEASKVGYYTGTNYYTVPNLPNYSFGTYAAILCNPTTVSAINTTLTVEVQDYLYNPLPSVLVSISDGQYKNTGTTGAMVTFTLANSTTYTITVSKSGYASQTEQISTGTNIGLHKVYRLTLPITPTKTPVSITPTLKPTPYKTTGGIMVNGTLCENPTNLFESIDFALCSQTGITDKTTQGLVKSLLLIFACICILCYIGRNTDNLGVLALLGACIGFIASLVLGFIELWVLLALLGLGFLIVIIIGRN